MLIAMKLLTLTSTLTLTLTPTLTKGGGPKTTNKLLVGLALGLRPLSPRWVHDCLRKGEWPNPKPNPNPNPKPEP
eukprot:scaffold44502_cov29-Phaeocystis_antarctica.AAC.1